MDAPLLLIFTLFMVGCLILLIGSAIIRGQERNDSREELGCPFAIYMLVFVWTSIAIIARWSQFSDVQTTLLLKLAISGIISGLCIYGVVMRLTTKIKPKNQIDP